MFLAIYCLGWMKKRKMLPVHGMIAASTQNVTGGGWVASTPTTSAAGRKSRVHETKDVPKGYKGIYSPPKMPKLDLATDAGYVANLVNVTTWL